jgi:hypothetical protein
VDFCHASNECVPGLHRVAQGFTPGHQPPTCIRYLKVNRQDPSINFLLLYDVTNLSIIHKKKQQQNYLLARFFSPNGVKSP